MENVLRAISHGEDGRMKATMLCGIVAGPLFVLAFLLEGATRADYDPLRHPVSSLALGPAGWTQTANFLIAGLLTTGFACGLARFQGVRHKAVAILVGLWGIGLLGAGAFVTDPVSGYPPGTPPVPDPMTTHGFLHDLFSVPAFFALAIACFVGAGGAGWRWLVYSLLSGLVVLIAFFVSGMGFEQTEPFVNIAGLSQRISVTVGWAWVTLLALRRYRRLPQTRHELIPRGTG